MQAKRQDSSALFAQCRTVPAAIRGIDHANFAKGCASLHSGYI
jgi:hypothetical protein